MARIKDWVASTASPRRTQRALRECAAAAGGRPARAALLRQALLGARGRVLQLSKPVIRHRLRRRRECGPAQQHHLARLRDAVPRAGRAGIEGARLDLVCWSRAVT